MGPNQCSFEGTWKVVVSSIAGETACAAKMYADDIWTYYAQTDSGQTFYKDY